MSLRRLLPLGVLAAALLVPTTAGAAAPSVDVEVRDSRITIARGDGLGRGPVRLRLSGDELRGQRTVAVVALKDGITIADLGDALDHDATAGRLPIARASEHALQNLERYGRVVAGGRVSPRESHVTTIVASAGEYAVLDVTSERGGAAAFTVGDDHNGTRVPMSDVTIGLRDRGFYLPSLLPTDGVVRISNQGDLLHQATAYRLRRTVTYREAVRGARRGYELSAYGTATTLTGVLSSRSVSRVEVSLRPGRYLVVSEYTPFELGALSDVDRGLVATTRVR